MKKSSDLALLNLSSEENPAKDENAATKLVEFVLYEARKRHRWGKFIKLTIAFAFTLIFIIVIRLFPFFIDSAFKIGGLLNTLDKISNEGTDPLVVILIVFYILGFLALQLILVVFFLGLLLLYIYFLPALISLPFSLYLSFRWNNPYNVLLLRPFSKKDTSIALKKMIRDGLSGLGFFYTLADSQIKQKWYVKYPILLGQLSLFQFRFRKIKSEKSVRKIQNILNRKRRRIFNWSVSRNKIFALTCSNDYWKPSVKELFSYADIILIDLSGFHSNVLWEAEECKRLDLLDRVVFLASLEDQKTLIKSLKTLEVDFVKDITFYGNNHFLDMHRILYQIALRIPNIELKSGF